MVSGVGPGLGRAIAVALAQEGASLAIGARTEAYLDDLSAQLRDIGVDVVAVPTDITSPEGCQALVEATAERLGGIDILVNNGHASHPQQGFADADLPAWRTSMDVNYWGSLQMTQAAVPQLAKSGDGRVININSMAMARIRPSDGPYVGSKSALAAATRYLAVDLGPLGIRVNGVHPGYMLEEKLERWFARQAEERGTTPEAVQAEIVAGSRLGYIPTADEVAQTVVFLASPMARPITGQCIHVNAGFHIA